MNQKRLRATSSKPSNIKRISNLLQEQPSPSKSNKISSPKTQTHSLSPRPLGSSQNDTLTQNKQQELIDSILQNSLQKRPIESLLNEEKITHSIIQKRKEQIDNINLIEQFNLNDLYKWKTLFNKSKALSSYTKINKLHQNIKNSNNKNKETFKFPCVLIDAPYEKFSMYFPKGMLNHKPNFNVTRAKSINAPRENNELFYFCKELSDYYIDDFKTFINKKPKLKAKRKCENEKLRYLLCKARKQNEITDRMLHGDDSKMQNLKKQCLDLSNRDIKLAINNNNASPLLQSIYHQIIAENNNNNNKQQSELNEDGILNECEYYSIDERERSYNEDNVDINDIQNDTNEDKNGQVNIADNKINNNEYVYNNNETLNSVISQMKYDTYNINDPQLGIFKQLIATEDITTNNKTQNNSNTNISSNNIESTKQTNHHLQKIVSLSQKQKHYILKKNTSHKTSSIFPLQKKLSPSSTKHLSNQVNFLSPNDTSPRLKISSSFYTSAFQDTFTPLIKKHININNSSLYDNDLKTNENTINSFISDYVSSNSVRFKTQTKIQNYTYHKMNMHLKNRLNKQQTSSLDNWNVCKFESTNTNNSNKTFRLTRPVSCVDIKSPSLRQRILKAKGINTINKNKNLKNKNNSMPKNEQVNMIYFNEFIDTRFSKEFVMKFKEKPTLENNYYYKPVNASWMKNNIAMNNTIDVIKNYKESNDESKTMNSYFNDKGKRVKSAKLGY